MTELRVPAVQVLQKQNRLYLFNLPGETLEKLVRSEAKTSTNPDGIQRLLNQRRLKDIAEYISRPETCFPNNIIVNFAKEVRFEAEKPNSNMGHLIFPSHTGHFGDVIDGQHRLYGIVHKDSTEKDMPMPVTGLMLSDGKSAARIFADINQLQKPISKLLLVTLQRELGDLVNSKDNAAAIAENLNIEKDSPLHNKIKMFQDETLYWLELDQVVNVLSPLFEKGQRLSFLPTATAYSRIRNYISAVAETFPDAWGDNKKYRLTAAAGFEIIMGLFERAHQRARANLKPSESPTKEDFMRVLEPIKETDWSSETFKEHGYTGSAGKRILMKELLDELPPEE